MRRAERQLPSGQKAAEAAGKATRKPGADEVVLYDSSNPTRTAPAPPEPEPQQKPKEPAEPQKSDESSKSE